MDSFFSILIVGRDGCIYEVCRTDTESIKIKNIRKCKRIN